MGSDTSKKNELQGQLCGVAVIVISGLLGFYFFFNALFSDGSAIQAIFLFMFVSMAGIFVGIAIIMRYGGGTPTSGLFMPRETRTVEKTYVYAPPKFCSTCGGGLNPQNVEWAGPLTVKCPYCGASHDAVKREV